MSGNGLGNRWYNGNYNYSVLYSNMKQKNYSENLDDKIPDVVVNNFITYHVNGITGIFIHSIKSKKEKRPIKNSISKQIKNVYVLYVVQILILYATIRMIYIMIKEY